MLLRVSVCVLQGHALLLLGLGRLCLQREVDIQRLQESIGPVFVSIVQSQVELRVLERP